MSVDLQTILVATDFSDASAPATAYAFSLARALKARLSIIHHEDSGCACAPCQPCTAPEGCGTPLASLP
jgi:hypothetical protein